MPNRLENESSPYLIQHAQNPVDWYPWGIEALARARAEDKPIFLSIGYAACHWCHVMAHESFKDASIAAIMNEHFINIKVDREQRPDLDSIYMSATVAMTGAGGWPMSVFLTPDLRPFYCGTYFPPEPRYGMPSFRELVTSIARGWTKERADVEDISAKVTEHIQRQASFENTGALFSPKLLDGVVRMLHDSYDWGFGGWGQAPKFPQPMTIEFLFRRHAAGNPDALKSATHALRSMARGGMYDVVGGGFSRYSTDNLWRVPHFEKMLYDNAQLASAYLHAYQITGEPFYRRIATETLDFVIREMTNPQGGFHSSLDADSEGEEGKFYVWTADELDEILQADWEFFKAAYGIHPYGNWEGKTVLQRSMDDTTLAARFHLPGAGVTDKLAECHSRLLKVRSTRIRPGTDDKVITAWNGLMLSAFAQATRILPIENSNRAYYLEVATRCASFLLAELCPNGQLRRAWHNGKTSNEVFLEDYAAMINGLLDLYQADLNPRWYSAAQQLADEMIARFSDPAGGFFDTASDGETLLLRPKDVQDNATPSGNALAVEALLKLAAYSDNGEYRALAEQSLPLIAEYALRHPTAFGRWLCAADFALAQVKQIAILGPANDPATQALISAVQVSYRPNMILAAADFPAPESSPALLNDRPLVDSRPTAYVCEGFICKMPVTSVEELQNLLD